MSETLFKFDASNFRECQKLYRGPHSGEYYLGDYTIEAGPRIDIRAERRTAGSCSIIRQRSQNRQYFRRSWSHIRADGTDVAVLWFVKRGRLGITWQGGRSLVGAGGFALTHSMSPFYMECQTDDEPMHSTLHAVIPTHILRRFIPFAGPTGFRTAAGSREIMLVERILTEVFEDQGRLSDQSCARLVDGALSVLHDALVAGGSAPPARRSLADRRLEQVLRFVDLHFSDPDLSLGKLASACGISRRYVSFLFELHGTPFSELIWRKRLEAAAEWLSCAEAHEVWIKEVAYRVGFKSSAHFSRLFKTAYHVSPVDYRTRHGGAGNARP